MLHLAREHKLKYRRQESLVRTWCNYTLSIVLLNTRFVVNDQTNSNELCIVAMIYSNDAITVKCFKKEYSTNYDGGE